MSRRFPTLLLPAALAAAASYSSVDEAALPVGMRALALLAVGYFTGGGP